MKVICALREFESFCLAADGLSWGEIDEVLWDAIRGMGDIGCFARRNVYLKALDQSCHVHRGREFAYPHMHAGLNFRFVVLDSKARFFHKVGRKKSCYPLDHPWVFLKIGRTHSKLGEMVHLR